MVRRPGGLFLGVGAGLLMLAGTTGAGSLNGRVGTMPAYYDEELFRKRGSV